MAEALHLRDLRVRLGARELFDVSCSVAPGQVLSVLGPSGSGKSTLLAAVAGHLPPEFTCAGQVLLGARDLGAVPAHRRQIGILFQDPLLFPHLSVGENLAFALPPGGGRAARRRQVEAALAQVGLAGFARRDPHGLSGGQKARVALMRALLARPRALLLDEPFASLDLELRAQIRALVFSMARDLPVILVTHDPGDAQAAGGAQLVLG